ncbi:MAG: hypothetical protein FWD32_01430, partial [Firmicutes bacterium]|nr:hypothetical protein [Bacillota bacterium]
LVATCFIAVGVSCTLFGTIVIANSFDGDANLNAANNKYGASMQSAKNVYDNSVREANKALQVKVDAYTDATTPAVKEQDIKDRDALVKTAQGVREDSEFSAKQLRDLERAQAKNTDKTGWYTKFSAAWTSNKTTVTMLGASETTRVFSPAATAVVAGVALIFIGGGAIAVVCLSCKCKKEEAAK